MAITGGCLCGAVRYSIDQPLARAGSCHCSMCRKAHGSAFATFAAVPPGSFTWVAGEDKVGKFQSSEEGIRCFCKVCGSPLGAMSGDALGWVTLGTVDGDPGVRSEANIFVDSKAPWFEILDGLPQFEEYPPDM